MGSTNKTPYSATLIGFFRDREDAYDAIAELQRAGFSQNQIGLAVEGDADVTTGTGAAPARAEERSTWQKIKDFFTGQPEMYDAADYDNFFGHLNLSRDRLMYYRSGLGRGGAVVTVSGSPGRQEEAQRILMEHDVDLRTSGFEQVEPSQIPEQRFQLRGELLRTIKERIQKGEIRLRKEVVTEQKTVNVPVSREEVIVEQVPPSERTTVAGTATIEEGKEVRIPVTEERVRVEKEPLVTGEVRVGKRTLEDTEQVSEELRHEELKVEKAGDVNLQDNVSQRKKPAA
jgi:uncharacterized protein (TIGR02271 family)